MTEIIAIAVNILQIQLFTGYQTFATPKTTGIIQNAALVNPSRVQAAAVMPLDHQS